MRKPYFTRPDKSRSASAQPFCSRRVATTMPSARVEVLLQADDNPDSLLELKAAGHVRQLFPQRSAPGQVIGPYKLLQQIGEGGMGTVYMAEQTEPVERKVALKIIKPGMDSRQVIAPFRGRASGLGPDGPSEHRQNARSWRHRHRPAVLRDGTGQGHSHHQLLRSAQAEHRSSDSSCFISVCSRRCSTPIKRESSTAI